MGPHGQRLHSWMTSALAWCRAHWESIVVTILWMHALYIRIVFSLTTYGLIFPDEIFQSKEMAHKWIFGYGWVPWEFKIPSNPSEDGAARNPFHALLYVPLLLLSMYLGWEWRFTVRMTSVMDAVVSALVIPAVYLAFKHMTRSPPLALGTAFLTSVWYWMYWIGVHSFSNVYYAPLVFCGFWFLTRSNNHDVVLEGAKIIKNDSQLLKKAPIREYFLSGLLFGMALMFRNDALILLILFILLYFNRLTISKRGIGAFIAGFFVTGILVLGMLDWWAFGQFWVSPWNNFKYNVIEGKAALHGNAIFGWYLNELFMRANLFPLFVFSSLMFIIQLLQLERGNITPTHQLERAKRKRWMDQMLVLPSFYDQLKLLLFFFGFIFALSITPNQQVRFLYPVLPFLFSYLLLGLLLLLTYLKWVLLKVKKMLQSVITMTRRQQAWYCRIVVACLILTSAGWYGVFRAANLHVTSLDDPNNWGDVMMAMVWVGEQEDVNGVFVFTSVFVAGGYFHLHKDVPVIYHVDVKIGLEELKRVNHSTYNYVILPRYAHSFVENLTSELETLQYRLVHVEDQRSEVWKYAPNFYNHAEKILNRLNVPKHQQVSN